MRVTNWSPEAEVSQRRQALLVLHPLDERLQPARSDPGHTEHADLGEELIKPVRPEDGPTHAVALVLHGPERPVECLQGRAESV